MEVSDEFVDLVTTAHAYLTERQEALQSEFRLLLWPRWDWSQGDRSLVFSENGVAKVIAEIQFVGTISAESGTWLWSWANPHHEPELSKDIREVRQLGEARGIPQLSTPRWPADEVDGWEMTSVSAYVLQARGAYRTPREEGGFTYMVITAIRWADEGQLAPAAV